MKQDERAKSLQFDVDPAAQRQEWRFERAGWALIALVLLAGLAGGLGGGSLARAEVVSPDARVTVRYDRIVHYDAPTSIVVTLPAGAPSDSLVAISVSRDFLHGVTVNQVMPAPVQMRAIGDDVEFSFRRAGPARPLEVVFSVTPNELGIHHAALRTDSEPMRLTQFVLP
jgi:hypothetical protein